jgi:hypothetical protein
MADMANVLIKCPKSGMPVPTGIAMDKVAFATATLKNNTVGLCPDCGESHTWSKDDAFLGGE